MTDMETHDTSVHDSIPIEAFLFVGPFGTYRYNDSEEDVTIEGQVYKSQTVLRDTIEVGTGLGNQGVVSVYVPFNSEVAVEHGYLSSPSYLTVTIYRLEHGTDYDTDKKTIWTGRAKGYAIQGLMLQINTQSVISGARTLQLLSAYWQRMCNFDLYDADTCKVNKADHTETSTVTLVGPSAITVVDDGFADHALPIGEVVNTRTGEKRLILDNLANVITLSFGFTDILVGDAVDIIRGCKHNTDDCTLVFDDIINYGGWKFIPRSSPLTD